MAAFSKESRTDNILNMRYLFIAISWTLSFILQKKKIVYFCSFYGQYNDNPKYISLKLHELYPEYNIIWAHSILCHELLPDYVKKAEFRSFMIMSILPYIVMFYINGNKKIKKCVIAFSIIGFVYLLSQEVVLALFDKTETSNDTKLGMFANYDVAFSNIRTLLLGDGLDSYFYTERGRVNNTELTYFELLRRFGLWGTIAYIFLMFKPA